MSTTQTRVAMQFDDPEQQRTAATLGMWTFLATEVLFFGGMFAGYLVYRIRTPQVWAEAGGHLNFLLGTVNTAVLLTSSLTMALAVDAVGRNNTRTFRSYLSATMVLGIAFLVIKGSEYVHKWSESLVPGAGFQWPGNAADAGPGQLFFSYYFVMTGCHALHMIVGLGLLSALLIRTFRLPSVSEEGTLVENVGLYWHFVDIIWVFLYPLLYLIEPV